MSIKRLCLWGVFALVPIVGCSSTEGPDQPDPEGPEAENLGVSQEAICGTSTVDWSAFPQGAGTQQCVHGVIVFYQNKFGVTPPAASGGPIGACAHYGACNIWVNPANQPNPAVWNKYAWGSATPQAYDMVVFPPTASNAYGHIASVDHYAAGKLWEMDSNWSPWKGIKAACVHDVGSYVPYGFYRLKSLEGAAPAAPAPPAAPATSCHDTAGEFTFTCDGTATITGQSCVNVDEPADPGTWTDNYFCSARDFGMKWSNSGAIAGMDCTQVGETAGGYAAAWADDYLCLPPQSPYSLSYSSAGAIAGKTCVSWNEPHAASWSDNYVCTDPVWNYAAGGFTFASHGTVAGQSCVATTESADTGWEDNFFCHEKDLGMKWSEAGPIDGMKCVNVTQPDEKTADVWKDNYLCVPNDSEYTFTWSDKGAIAGQACVRWYDHDQTSATSLAHYMCMQGPGTDVAPPTGSVNGEATAPIPPANDPTADASDSSGGGCSTSPSTHARSTGIALALAALFGTMLLARRGRRGPRRL